MGNVGSGMTKEDVTSHILFQVSEARKQLALVLKPVAKGIEVEVGPQRNFTRNAPACKL